MAHEYTEANFDPSRCKASVSDRLPWPHFYQCSRKPWRDGWCRQHHPETEKARREKAYQDYLAKQERRAAPMRRLEEENARLREALTDWTDEASIIDGRLDEIAAEFDELDRWHNWLTLQARRIREALRPAEGHDDQDDHSD